MNRIDLKQPAGYDQDFALWSAEQAELLRAGDFEKLDLGNLAEEIESLGRSDKYEIVNRLEVLLCHLLKWQLQREKRSNSWRATILEQRLRILDVLQESPSLKRYPGEKLDRSYIIGRSAAIDQTHLPEVLFPDSCPYAIEQILDPDFWPD